MQPTSSGGLRHPDASEFSEHPIKEVPEVSLKPLGLLGLNRGRLRGRVFKIGSCSALVAEICAGPHHRLLRRQHCSSLCSQSEGHEHVANMANALAHDFVGFLALFGRHNIRPPHFASKVSYSAAPHSLPPAIRVIRPSAFKIFAAKPLKPGNHLAISLKTRNFAPLIKYNHN